jgi:hypothetical protein
LRRLSCSPSFSSSSSIRGGFEYEDDDEGEDDLVAAEPLRGTAISQNRRVLRRFSCSSSFSSSSSIRGGFEYEDDDEGEDDLVAAEPLRGYTII